MMPFKVSVRSSDESLTKAGDEDLFGLMRNIDQNPVQATSAWNEFYRRYSSYIWNSCARVCSSVTEGDRLAKDIFQSTMKKIFTQAKTYDPQKGVGIKAWSSRIAYNEFIDYYNKYNRHFVSFDSKESEMPEIAEDFPDENEENNLTSKLLSIRKDQLTFILSKLNAKEFKVLMTYMNFYQIDKPNAHLPDPEMEKLCVEFTVKSDTIRQIKRRAILKLKKLAKEL